MGQKCAKIQENGEFYAFCRSDKEIFKKEFQTCKDLYAFQPGATVFQRDNVLFKLFRGCNANQDFQKTTDKKDKDLVQAVVNQRIARNASLPIIGAGLVAGGAYKFTRKPPRAYISDELFDEGGLASV